MYIGSDLRTFTAEPVVDPVPGREDDIPVEATPVAPVAVAPETASVRPTAASRPEPAVGTTR